MANIETRFGVNRPKFALHGQCCPNLDRVSDPAVTFRQRLTKHWRHFAAGADRRPTFGQRRPFWAKLGLCRTAFVPMLAKCGQCLAQTWQTCSTWVRFGPKWQTRGPNRQDLVKLWPILAQVGQRVAQSGQCWSNLVRVSAPRPIVRQLLDDVWTTFGQLQSSPGSPGVSFRDVCQASCR